MRRLLHAGMSRNSVETLSCWRVRWQGGWVGRMDEACGICRDANRMALNSRARLLKKEKSCKRRTHESRILRARRNGRYVEVYLNGDRETTSCA